VKLVGLLLGDNVDGLAKELGGYGADKVIVVDDPALKVYTTDAYAKAICDVIADKKPEIFLIGATNIGRDLGPRCAARLHTGLCADCTHLDIDMDIYKDFLKNNSVLKEERIDGLGTAQGARQGSRRIQGSEDDPSGIRRKPDGFHHLPALPSVHGYRSSGRSEESSVRSGEG
jgi:electron transfer flavoprotein alpha subunit